MLKGSSIREGILSEIHYEVDSDDCHSEGASATEESSNE
jgi:hypothetical protein